jgi:hypothetical protein
METQETATPTPPTPRKPRLPYIAGGIIVVLLLVGAAFVGGRLLNGQEIPGFSSKFGPEGGGGPQTRRETGSGLDNDIQPAKELPQIPADVSGLFDHRKDNSIFVGTGQVTMTVQRDQSGNAQTSSGHDGPTVEVVVTPQTIVYEDVTSRQFKGQPPAKGQKVQQVLELGSLDKIGQNSMITVWGKKTGDRFIADILVYSQPDFMMK